VEQSLVFASERGTRTTKKLITLTCKWTTFERWTTKAVRMTREMRRRSGAMIPVMIDPDESGLLRHVQKGSLRRTLD